MALSQEEFEKLTARLTFGRQGSVSTETGTSLPKGNLQNRLATVGFDASNNIRDAIGGTGQFEGDSSLSRGTRATAEAFGVVPKGAYEIAPEPIRKAVDFVGEKIGGVFKAGVDKLSDMKLFKEVGELEARGFITKENSPELFRVRDSLKTVSASGEISGSILAAQGVRSPLQKVSNKIESVSSKIKGGFDGGGGGVGGGGAALDKGVNAVKNTASGIAGIARPAVDAVRNVPSNIRTNAQSSRVFQE